MRRLATLAALLSLAVLLQAAAPPVDDPKENAARALDRKVLDSVKKDTQVLKNLTHLSDVIGPRLTGSDSLNKAAQWAEKRMKDYGLTNVRLEPWSIPEGWQRGKASARVVEPSNGRAVHIASMGWYPGTKGKVTGDVVVLDAQNEKDLAQYKGKLKNAIILSGAPYKMLDIDKLTAKDKLIFRAYEARIGDFRKGKGYQEAVNDLLQKEGVAAVFRDAGKPFNLTVTTGGWQSKDRSSANNRVPSLFVAHGHYEMLHRLAMRKGERTQLELEVENKFIPGPVPVYNVVGEIKGSEKPDEYVVLGAHLDSWDLGQGTLDNGTGSCVVLEAARALATCGVAPKRTVRFVLFAGEEQGLHGSRYHVSSNKEVLSKISAAFVHDTGTGRVKGVGTGGRPAMQALFEEQLRSLRDIGVTDFSTPSGGGSDHLSFAGAGVPAFMMVQEPAGYVFAHHTEADTLDAAKEADLIQGAQTMAVTAMRVANYPTLLPRSAGRGR